MKHILIIVFSVVVILSCETKDHSQKTVEQEVNPAANGFDKEGSDQNAIEIADEVMKAMGGRKNWDQERFFRWNFFGFRTLWWDKHEGNVAIQMHDADSMKVLLNIFNDSGRVALNGEEMTHPDSVAKYVQKGKSIWINDSYWLFMPFKLKDSGVTLTYVSEDTLENNVICDILQLTFKEVGDTPQNKYHVWVDRADHLVKQWAFYRNYEMEEPNFTYPWNDYKKYNSLYLSGDRGKRQITDIMVADQMDNAIFNNL